MEAERIVLNDELVVESGRPHRAVLIQDNGEDVIHIEQKVSGKWTATPGTWSASTLIKEYNPRKHNEDTIAIDGDHWVVESGMVDTLAAYVRTKLNDSEFMTTKRQEIISSTKKHQSKMFGEFAASGNEERILQTQKGWGA